MSRKRQRTDADPSDSLQTHHLTETHWSRDSEMFDDTMMPEAWMMRTLVSHVPSEIARKSFFDVQNNSQRDLAAIQDFQFLLADSASPSVDNLEALSGSTELGGPDTWLGIETPTEKPLNLIRDMHEYLRRSSSKYPPGINVDKPHAPSLESYPIGDILDFSRVFIDAVSTINQATKEARRPMQPLPPHSLHASTLGDPLMPLPDISRSQERSPCALISPASSTPDENTDTTQVSDALLAISCHLRLTDIYQLVFADMRTFLARASPPTCADNDLHCNRTLRGMHLNDFTTEQQTYMRVYTGIKILLGSYEAFERAAGLVGRAEDPSNLTSVTSDRPNVDLRSIPLSVESRQGLSACSTMTRSLPGSTIDTPPPSALSSEEPDFDITQPPARANAPASERTLLGNLSHAISNIDPSEKAESPRNYGPNELRRTISSVKQELREKMRLQ